MWSDWDFHIDTNNAWYTDDGYAALPISENLTITGDWYDPAKATRRKTLEVVASTGMLFPPNFLFMAGLWPDKRCRGTLFYTFRAKTKYRVTGAALDGAITLSLYPADDGQVLANAVCEPS